MSDAPEPVATTPEAPASAPASSDALASLTDTQRNEWLRTGDVPGADAEASAPDSSATTNRDDVGATAESAVPEATAQKPPNPRHDVNARIGQLSEQRRLAMERADAAERRAAELEARLADTPSREAPAPPATPAHADLVKRYQQAPDWPTLDGFVEAGFDDPYAAMLAAQAAYIGEAQFTERRQADELQTIRTQAEMSVERTFAAMKTEFPHADPSTLRDLDGPGAATFAQLLFESPSSARLLNYFSQHSEEARMLAAMEPAGAAYILGQVESALSTAAPSRVATPTKTVSGAPDPPPSLGSRHTPSAGDEVEEALRDGDTGRYITLQNQRELAAMKAGQR